MNQKLFAFLILSMSITISAQSINLHGKVTNKSGKPVAGAVVSLSGNPLKDTTDAAGEYVIQNNSTEVKRTGILPVYQKVEMINGILKLSLAKTSSLKIGFFDLKGNCVSTVIKQNVSAGDYNFDIADYHIASAALVIKVSIENISSTFRYIPVGKLTGTLQSVMQASTKRRQEGVLFKLTATVDSLKVNAQNYVSSATALTSYTGEVNVTLDSITLAKFSFFVTSQKALQDLSRSANGFGGDLRFGKTGVGAGLRGADSICECIAEKSMPGSKVKVWRAFLSISKDENGNAVNAVERIGNGPWYDRLGRLLAPTLSDLINARPTNGDATIKNDLPNEDGVPNHYPNGATAVDNHHMITGSTTQGKLYSTTSTCNDWTSTTASGKPRCGFAWPRDSRNTYSWISGYDANGCEAGYETVNNGGGTPGTKIIGSGGGYGGFYCFALNP